MPLSLFPITRFIRWRSWPLRAQLAGLMVAASVLPIGLATFVEVRETRSGLFDDMRQILEARAEQIVHEFDRTHTGYQGAVVRMAHFPDVIAFCTAPEQRRAELGQKVSGLLATFPVSDPNIRGAGLIDASGRLVLATEGTATGADLSRRVTVRQALGGARVISDMYIAATATGEKPSVGYLVPVVDSAGKVVCAVGVWVHATVFWDELHGAGGLAGLGSYAVVLNAQGVRMANSRDPTSVFRPAGELAPSEIAALVQSQAFGARTAELLNDVRPFPEQFRRARAKEVESPIFRGFSPTNQAWNYGVTRRLSTAPWTVFYMAPEQAVLDQVNAATREKLLIAAAAMLLAALVGLLFATSILRTLRALHGATARLAQGDADVRVPVVRRDELGKLAESFNAMADRLSAQDAALRASRDELELRVQERTAELSSTASRLQTELANLKIAEREIGEHQDLLKAIVDNTAAVITVKDLDGRYMLVNQRFTDLSGVVAQEAIGRRDRELFEPHVAAEFRRLDMLALQADQPVFEEQTLFVPDKGMQTFITVKCQRRGPDGVVTGVVGISTDITERKRAESRQRAQLERLNLLDQITTAIAARQDIQSIYQVVVRSLEERLPLDFACICLYDAASSSLTVMRVGVHSLDLALGMAMQENAQIAVDENGLSQCVSGRLVYEPDIGGSLFPFPRRLARGQLRSLVIAPLQSEGKVFAVLVAARRRVDGFDGGDCEFIRQLCGHVSLAAQQVRLYEDLLKAYGDLKRTQLAVLQQERLSALGQMASGIAHDINNAISPVSLYAETLLEREPGLSAQARRYLEIIARAIDDVAATVSRMREFYRPEDADSQRMQVDLNQIVTHVVDLTRPRWSDQPLKAGAAVTLRLDLAENAPHVLGLENELRDALVNLVFNAVDAMPRGGVLGICTGTTGQGKAFFEVTDTGEGMDESTRQRCLEPFFTTKGQRGTGLGLAMVYGVAQRHGAALEIESAPGAGTAVRLVFAPLASGVDSVGVLAGPLPVQPRRLLVVDDDPVLLTSMKAILEADGHSVTSASGGQEGIDNFAAALAARKPFDVVITDLGMPDVGGQQVAATVKRLSPATGVLLLTGWGQRLLSEGDIPPHVDAVLGKPPKLQALRTALQNLSNQGGTK